MTATTARKFVVTFTRIPTNFNDPRSIVVEAASESDACAIARHHILDLGELPNFVYRARAYEPPPEGRVLG